MLRTTKSYPQALNADSNILKCIGENCGTIIVLFFPGFMNFLVSFFVIDVSIFLFFLSSIAALSDLNLILAAPRLLPSSIFYISVYF